MRNFPKLLTVAVVALAAVIAPTTAAHADANGCTQLGSWITDSVCIAVVGKGQYVKTATAKLLAPIGKPCNTKLYITFFDLKQTKYSQSISASDSKCQSARFHTQSYYATMRVGRVCAAVSINGAMKLGACVSIVK
ncbi:hypothetical protein B0I32_108296 [Nonomuraea fuscirosea]|uniref:Uncharacterized protein n=1 Tax=Nonomuraea fuscirosea TaxID=1291556 RepID=A0A2T0MZW9_9ACTN|nr:hypothetical protein [Nonomuraea fuscirosea]PRX64935.1 hypothetical protein B0I32_108296 [Nonomuraea fuscirosea]